MRGFLLDTNVLSELLRKRPAPSVLERLQSAPKEELLTSVICLTELRFGASRVPSGEKLWARIADEVLPRVRALPIGEKEGVLAGDVLADLEMRGETIGVEDVLIGATALANGLTVVTRNLRHFQRIQGLKTESWWPVLISILGYRSCLGNSSEVAMPLALMISRDSNIGSR